MFIQIPETKLQLPPKKLLGIGVHQFDLTDESGNIIKRAIYKNMIVSAGLNMLMRILMNLVTASEGLNYCALGTGSGTIAAGNTALENEGARKIRGSNQVVDNIGTVAFYFGPSVANGVWTRYGTFIDGTDTADSGTLFTHVAIDLTKSEGQGLTITSQYTLTSTSP